MYLYKLTDEQKELQRTIREFADKEVRPISERLDQETHEVPWDLILKGCRLGLTSCYVPKRYGGSVSGIDSLIMTEELAAADAGTAFIFSATGLGIAPLAVARNKEQMDRFFPEIVEGEKKEQPVFWAYGLTEPEAGSDLEDNRGSRQARLVTTAVRQGDKYIISGRKCFITMGSVAKWVSLFATVDPERKVDGFTCFAVSTNSPGFSIGRVENKMGHRSVPAAELILEDVEVPVENRIGEEGQGWFINRQCLAISRPAVAAAAIGIAREAYEIALDYATKRYQGGTQIVNHEVIQVMLADMLIQITAARLLAWEAAIVAKEVRPVPMKYSSMAKVFASDMAVKVCTDAIQILGGYGYMKDYRLEKLYRDIKVSQIYEGTNQINRFAVMDDVLDEIGYQ